jgi:hypothetical protein
MSSSLTSENREREKVRESIRFHGSTRNSKGKKTRDDRRKQLLVPIVFFLQNGRHVVGETERKKELFRSIAHTHLCEAR